MNREQRRKAAKKLKQKIRVFDLRKFKIGPLPADGNSEEKCYANILENCAGGISREHYISENVLSHFPSISSKGVPWLAHKVIDLPTEALVTKCLCQRHNNHLSPLDEFAGQFFTQLKSFGTDKPEKTIIPGKTLERWMLKTLVGLIATNKISHKEKGYSVADIEPSWIKIIFGQDEFPNGCGLYVFYTVGNQISFSNSFSVGPTFLNDELCGLDLVLGGMRLMLTLKPKEQAFKTTHENYSYLLYRPTAFNKDPYPQELRFDWN